MTIEKIEKIEEVEKSEKPDVIPSNPQFLMLLDQTHVAMLSKMMPGVKYLQVEGMDITDKPTHQLLVNPKMVHETTT